MSSSINDRMFACYFRSLMRFKLPIILFWSAMFWVGVFFGLPFLNETKTTFAPPPGTDAYYAEQLFKEGYGVRPNSLLIYIQSQTGQPVLGSFVESVSDTVQLVLKQEDADIKKEYSFDTKHIINRERAGFNTVNGTELDNFVKGDFYVLPDLRAIDTNISLSSSFVSKDGKSTFIAVTYDVVTEPMCQTCEADFIRAFLKLCENLSGKQRGKYFVGLTGVNVLFLQVIEASQKDLENQEFFVMPIALLVLAGVLRSWRLMVIPVLSVFISLVSSFLLLRPFTYFEWLDVASFAPNIMSSLVIAMSIDYSLFLLTRFREELAKGRTNESAVANMSLHAGKIVAVSGCTLAVTFLGLAFFPLDFLRSVGVGASLTLLMTVAINLTYTPALILFFHNFFRKSDDCMCLRRRLGFEPPVYDDYVPIHQDEAVSKPSPRSSRLASRIASQSHSRAEGEENKQMASLQLGSPVSDHPPSPPKKGFWLRSAEISTTSKWALVIIIAMTAVTIPFAIETTQLSITIDNTQLFPSDSSAQDVLGRLTTDFSAGQISPYYVLMRITKDGVPYPNGTFTECFYNATMNMLDIFDRESKIVKSEMMAMYPHRVAFNASWLPPGNWSWIPPALAKLPYWKLYRNLAEVRKPKCNTSVYDINSPETYSLYQCTAELYQISLDSLASKDKSTSLVELYTDFNPLGDFATDWVREIRVLLREQREAFGTCESEGNVYHIDHYVYGASTSEIDAVARIYELFPSEIALTCAVVFCIVAFIFRSLFVPFRLLITIAVPITIIYGLGVLVFMKSDLFGERVPHLFWLTPVMTFSILVGLGLDYDIFLFSRIYEYRVKGVSDRVSILKGISKTGGIITAAGVIMTIAFGGLMGSSQMVLKQFGFFLCIAVMIDTFLVRTLLVPAIMHFAGRINWWPSRMPEAVINETNFHDDSDDEEDAITLLGGAHARSDADGSYRLMEEISPDARRGVN